MTIRTTIIGSSPRLWLTKARAMSSPFRLVAANHSARTARSHWEIGRGGNVRMTLSILDGMTALGTNGTFHNLFRKELPSCCISQLVGIEPNDCVSLCRMQHRAFGMHI